MQPRREALLDLDLDGAKRSLFGILKVNLDLKSARPGAPRLDLHPESGASRIRDVG
jgi:hypothetical protein